MGKNVIVIGAGASGLMAAILAARSGARVTILERMKKPGRKILATGNGKCNLTNTEQGLEKYRGENPLFVVSALEQFSVADTMNFFEELGVVCKEKKGYIYPQSEQAISVLEVLLMECERLKIVIKGQEEIKSVKKQEELFLVETSSWTYQGEALILATGSKAAPVYGSDGSGYELARQFGHRLQKPLQALVPLKVQETYYGKLAGVRREVRISLFVEDALQAQEEGELQISSFGVSGIAVFQVSRFAVKALEQKKRAVLYIDFAREYTKESLEEYLWERREKSGHKRVSAFLTGFFPQKLAEVVYQILHIKESKNVNELTAQEIRDIGKLLKEFPATIVGSHSFEFAQACQGGVDTEEINPHTLESKLVSKLYFAGEIIDIDGVCGGYNLQWAWSSGFVAGTHAGRE